MQQVSPKTYAQCCEVFHLGKTPATPEQLMRSRFSAFVLGLSDYIRDTWHPSTRPQDLHLSPDDQWVKLDIIKSSDKQVHFHAFFKDADSSSGFSVLDEISDFVFEEKRWFYVSGITNFAPAQLNRNDVCLCGSGKKYKKCCLAHP